MLASSIAYEQVTKMISSNYITSPIDILTGKNNHTRNIVSVKSVITTVYKVLSGKYGKDFTKNYLKMSKYIIMYSSKNQLFKRNQSVSGHFFIL